MRRHPGWAGAALGAGALVKLYPALLVLGLVGMGGAGAGAEGGGRRWSSLIRAAAGAAAVAGAGYLPHVVVVGWRVVGYLPGYLREEHYVGGGRYLLAGTAVVAAAGLFGAAAWVTARRPGPPRAFAVLMGALLLATTPVQPWYAVTLLAAATVAAAPAWTLVAAAGYPYFFAVILDAPHTAAFGRASYGMALAGVAAGAALRRRRARDRAAAATLAGRG